MLSIIKRFKATTIANQMIALGSVLTAIFTLIYVVVAYRQLGVMSDQLRHLGDQTEASAISANAARSAADTAKKTLNDMTRNGEDTRNQIDRVIIQQQRTANAMERNISQAKVALDATIDVSRADQRAWVTVHGFSLPKAMADLISMGKFPTISLLIINSGRTPAIDVSVAGNLIVRQTLSREDLADTIIGERTSNMILAANGPPSVVPLSSDQAVSTQRQVDGVMQGITQVYAVGTIYYNDVFNRGHKTRFCFSVGILDYGKGMAACKDHNSIE